MTSPHALRGMRLGRRLPPVPHLVVGALCVGLCLPLWGRWPLVLAVALPIAVVGLLRARPLVPALIALGLVAGCWWGSARLDALDRTELGGLVGEAGLARVEVTGPGRRSEFATRVPVRVRLFGQTRVSERAQLVLPPLRAPPQGSILETVASVTSPAGRAERDGAPGFDEAAYLRRLGVHVVLRARRYRIVGRRGGFPGAADRIRSTLERSVARGLDGERRALVEGVVLGADEGLTKELRDRFRAAGLYHLLAVSGQNVAYVVIGILLLSWIAGVPRWLGHVIALGAVLGYVLAVGWQPSVVRAGVAGGLTSLAWLLGRERDRWYFLLLGAAVLLAVSPYALLDPGFQLSFSAVAAIFLLVPRLERRLRAYPVPRLFVSVCALSAGCGIATAPILFVHFGSVPILSVASNALAAPVVAPMLGLGLLSAAVAPVLPGAADVLGWLNGWLAEYLAGCARMIGGLPFAQVRSGWVILGLCGLLALALVHRRLPAPRAGRTLAVALLALTAVAGWFLLKPGSAEPKPPAGLRITFLDVGQGDSALVEVPEGAVLIDQGPPEARVAERLERLGVRRLALVVLTHPQRDHVGGAAEVLERVRVTSVLDPRQPTRSADEEQALEAASERHVPVRQARAGELLRLGDLRMRVLWPEGPGPAGADPNEHAVVLLASYGKVDALFTADAESNVTGKLELQPVEILKVAHHGSEDEGLEEGLRRLRPRLAVISVGAHNDYGHPTPSTLSALSRVPGLRLYRTDVDGTIVVESDGSTMAVVTER